MSKSLEALEELKDEIIPDYGLEYEDDEGYKNWIDELYQTIKQDLKRLEDLEGVWLKEEWCEGVHLNAESLKSLLKYNEELFEKNLELDKENEKLTKAIEIIKNKKVNIHFLFLHKLEDYNRLVCNAYQLTQEEYDLLKEVLEND